MNTSKNISGANFQVRKFKIIEWVTNEEDVTTIKEIEAIQKKRRIAKYEKSLKPMTETDLLKRIEQSERDVKEGRVISHSEVKKLIATWK
jgi:hypothetical protein